MNTYILYNPLSDNGKDRQYAEALHGIIKDRELIYTDITALGSYRDFFAKLGADDNVVVCGGDGTRSTAL